MFIEECKNITVTKYTKTGKNSKHLKLSIQESFYNHMSTFVTLVWLRFNHDEDLAADLTSYPVC